MSVIDVAESLKQSREERGMSPYELACALGINHQNVYRWERGQALPSIEMCVKLADFYGVSLDELLGRRI